MADFFCEEFESRRMLFEMCEWWSQKVLLQYNGKPDYSKMAHENRPAGIFYAEEVGTLSESPQQLGDVRYTAKRVSLSTTDDIMGRIFRDDIVRYDGRFWRVDSITLQRDWRRSQFGKNNREGAKVITLRS